jgi:hypothetical protein
MIDNILDTLASAMDSFFVRLPELNLSAQKSVNLSSITNSDGSVAIPGESLGLSMVSIEEDRTNNNPRTVSSRPNGTLSAANPEIRLNIYILLAANFTNYKTGLQFISAGIRFFQSKNVFTPGNTPGLDSSIEKIIVDLYTLSLEQQHHLWGILGSKYLPSVMYRLRMVIINENSNFGDVPLVERVQYNLNGI